MEKRIFIGVDGGGTKSHLAAADCTGHLLKRISGASTNHQSTEHSAEHMEELLQPFQGQSIDTAVFHLSGWDFQQDRNILSGNVCNALKNLNISIGNLILENDIFAILKSGLGRENKGVCLISGTGVLGAAVHGEKLFRTYGFSIDSGEWGSGIDIGKEAVRHVLSSSLGREEPCSLLTETAFDFFEVESAEALAEKVCGADFDTGRYSLFCPHVFSAASRGSLAAEAVLNKAGSEHAKTANGLLKLAGMNKAPLILGGGVFQHNGLLPGFREALQIPGEDLDIRLVKSDPVFGALLWAMESGGADSTEEIQSYIKIERFAE